MKKSYFIKKFAEKEGFEPTTSVLKTTDLPLNYSSILIYIIVALGLALVIIALGYIKNWITMKLISSFSTLFTKWYGITIQCFIYKKI